MISYECFLNNLEKVRGRIEASCLRIERPFDSVKLLPVTKGFPETAIEYVHRAGLSRIGENRVQEAISKKEVVTFNMEWELIGHLQSNKAVVAVSNFDRIQSVDSEKLLIRLDRIAGKANRVLRVLLQVNAGEDPAKFGVHYKDGASFLKLALGLKFIEVEGFMTIAPLSGGSIAARSAFRRLRELRDRLEKRYRVPLTELSMGMSGELEEAIEEGSTMVRIGSDLFGKR